MYLGGCQLRAAARQQECCVMAVAVRVQNCRAIAGAGIGTQADLQANLRADCSDAVRRVSVDANDGH